MNNISIINILYLVKFVVQLFPGFALEKESNLL